MNKLTRSSLRIRIIFLLLGLTVFLPARAQVNAEQVTAIGRNVLAMDDYMLAIHYFNMAIKAKDYLAEPYFLRALAKMKLDDFRGAEADCNMALERSKYLTEAHRLRGYVRLQIGLDSLALEDINMLLKENPQDKELVFYKTMADMNLKRYDEAEGELTELIEDNPQFFEGLTARGFIKFEKGDTEGALKDFEASVAISKTQEYPWGMIAQIYSDRQDWPHALVALDEVIRFYPDEPDLYLNRAFMRYKTDDYYGAMSDYNTAIKLDPKNADAIFNRALLHYEVMELNKAADDFGLVLKLEPNNFHALYNRALIYLQTRNYKKAEPDFQKILKKYPRFYPAYYVLAECRQAAGDEKGAIQYMLKGDELVRNYVDNPKKNPLDRPIIAEQTNRKNKGKRNSARNEKAKNVRETDMDIMSRFNQLITTEVDIQSALSFNDRYKGRVQDRESSVAPAPLFHISMSRPQESMIAVGNYFRELGELNMRKYIPETFYLIGEDEPLTEEDIDEAFNLILKYTRALESDSPRAADYIARGVLHTMLKNYEYALTDFNEALKIMPDYTVALMGKAFAAAMMMSDDKNITPRMVAGFYDEVLEQNPQLVYAWFNKGNILYDIQDYKDAEACYSKALELNPELAQAYYNRGLTRVQQNRKEEAFSDLSKAGELGVMQGYRVMKSLDN